MTSLDQGLTSSENLYTCRACGNINLSGPRARIAGVIVCLNCRDLYTSERRAAEQEVNARWHLKLHPEATS